MVAKKPKSDAFEKWLIDNAYTKPTKGCLIYGIPVRTSIEYILKKYRAFKKRKGKK